MARDTFVRRGREGDSSPDPEAPDAAAQSDEQIPASGESQESAPPATEPAAAAPAEKEEAEKTEEERPSPHSKRTAVFKSIREKREREEREARGEEPVVEPAAETPEEPAKEEPKPETPVAKRKIKVDGREREVTDEELLSAARKHFAAEGNFEEAKRASRQAREELAEIQRMRHAFAQQQTQQRATQQEQPPAEPEAQPRAKGKIDPTRLRETVEKIQFGDPEEGAQALASAIETAVSDVVQARGPNVSPDEIVTRAAQAVQQQYTTQRIYSEFKARHPEVESDPYMRSAAIGRTREMCIEAMRNYVHPENDAVIPEQWLQKVERAQNPQEVFDTYSRFREAGWNLPHDLGERAAVEIERRYNLRRPAQQQPAAQRPAPAVTAAEQRSQTREIEKREMPRQPQRANVTTRATQGTPPPRSRADTVLAMRRSRGFKF